MKIGIGLQAAVPGYRATEIGQWAADSERLGFHAVGVIDRLIYDNLDPLVTLAAAAEATTRIELMTSVINVLWRRNPVLLAKQMLTVDQISGGRLTAGLGMGAWPEDYEVSGEPQKGRGETFEQALVTMRRVWDGEVSGVSGPIPAQPKGRPEILLAALVPAGWARIARHASGWAAPAFMFPVLEQGIQAVNDEWSKAGRQGSPRVTAMRYFSLGENADAVAKEYFHHYYANVEEKDVDTFLGDTLTTPERIREELVKQSEVGVDTILLFPCSSDLTQVGLLATTLDDLGARNASGTFDFTTARESTTA